MGLIGVFSRFQIRRGWLGAHFFQVAGGRRTTKLDKVVGVEEIFRDVGIFAGGDVTGCAEVACGVSNVCARASRAEIDESLSLKIALQG